MATSRRQQGLFDSVRDPAAAGPRERFEAVAHSVRDVLSQRWARTVQTYERKNPKRIYYLSMEFLIGRSRANNVMNLLLDPFRLPDDGIVAAARTLEEFDHALASVPTASLQYHVTRGDFSRWARDVLGDADLRGASLARSWP